MQEQENGKELIAAAPEPMPLERSRSKPTLVHVGSRVISSDGRFHATLAAEYLLDHARKCWMTVANLSKVFANANTIAGKRCVRKNMFRVFTILLNHGEFLVYETAANRRIHAVKLLDVKSDAERQMARPQLERMKLRHQLTTAKYEKALQVIELQENL